MVLEILICEYIKAEPLNLFYMPNVLSNQHFLLSTQTFKLFKL